MAVFYNPNAGCLKSALHFSNTSVESVVRRLEFWILLILHVSLHFCFWHDYLPTGFLNSNRDSDFHVWFHDLDVIGSMTTFFQVFFTHQCYSRYLHLYATTRLLLGNLYDYCFELRLYLGDSCHEYTRLAHRQIMASALLFFEELNDDTVWDGVKRQALVRAHEQEFLDGFAANHRPMIMLQWSAETARAGHTLAKAPPNTFKALLDKLLVCRTLQQEVMDITCLQIPFQYFHLLKMMILVTSLIWAWRMATNPSILAPVLYFLLLVTLMGMSEVSAEMSDPFGDDAIDFPVVEWMEEFIAETSTFMEFQSPPDFIKKALESEKPLQPRELRLLMETAFSRDGSPDDDSPPLICGYSALRES